MEVDRRSSGDEAQACSSSSAEVESVEVVALDEAMPAPAKPVDAFASPPAQLAPRSPSDATLKGSLVTPAPDAWSTPLPSPGPQTPLGAVFRAVELATSGIRPGTHKSPRPRSMPSKLPSSTLGSGVGGKTPQEPPVHPAMPVGNDAALLAKGTSIAAAAGVGGRGIRSNRVVIGEAATPVRLQGSRSLSRVSLRAAANTGVPTTEACFKPHGRDGVVQDYAALGKHLSPFAAKPAHTRDHVRCLTRSTTTSTSSAER